MNKVILMGNLGADPELRYTASGMPLLSMRLATNETFVDRSREVQERTEWHSVVLWGSRAEALSRMLTKGECVVIEGSLRTTSYERDGVKRTKTEVVVRDLRFAGRRLPPPPPVEDAPLPPPPPDTPRMGTNGTAPRPAPAAAAPAMEEMPF
jgi:single-strand DNA-binding protein